MAADSTQAEDSLFEEHDGREYLQEAFGTWGTFKTRAGRVDFLETKARLSNPPGTSRESRLTQYLCPVREALPVAEMNFNQLLQRDLDDHRVAVELVPYLLNADTTGPAFFPPVVACLLPFSENVPQPHFDVPSAPREIKEMGRWSSVEFGDAFRIDRLLGQGDREPAAKLGRLKWNPEMAKLVIIDGQHRAMALLAIDRTLHHRWTGSAEKYKSFYEPVVKRCLEGMTDEQKRQAFESVELPVVVTWFPDLPPTSSQLKAARKVFVDLNKNARPPSPSRLMLLSDGDLYSIFTRDLLNGMRADGTGYPIYAVEYDNPSRDQASNAKWSTLTNVTIVFECVRRVLSGPDKHFADMSSTFVGRDNEANMRLVLRQSLDLVNVLPETIRDDRLYERDEIDERVFPPTFVPTLVEQFNEGWGHLLRKVYADLAPFRAHADALRQLQSGWITNGEPASSLAKEAMFEGAGLYWTLRESEAHWRAENERRRLESKPLLPRTDVVNAWDVTELKRGEFDKLRAKVFLGSVNRLLESQSAFSVFATSACQVGFVLAVRAIARQVSVGRSQVKLFADAIILAANAAMRGRETFVARGQDKSLNLLPKMDTPFAVYFRYFWLELLSTPEALQQFTNAGFGPQPTSLASEGRRQYRTFLIKLSAKLLRQSKREMSERDAEDAATKDTDESLGRALKQVFKIKESDYRAWVLNANSLPPPVSEDAATDVSNDSDSASSDAAVDELERTLREMSVDGSNADTSN